MNFNIENIFSFVSFLSSIAFVIWKASEVKSDIYRYIDGKVSEINNNQNTSNHQIDISLREAKYEIDKDIGTINGKVERCKHRSNRLENAICDVQEHLKETANYQPTQGLTRRDF